MYRARLATNPSLLRKGLGDVGRGKKCGPSAADHFFACELLHTESGTEGTIVRRRSRRTPEPTRPWVMIEAVVIGPGVLEP